MGLMTPRCKLKESGYDKSGLRAMTSPKTIMNCELARAVPYVIQWLSFPEEAARALQSRMRLCVLIAFYWSCLPSFCDSSWLFSQMNTKTSFARGVLTWARRSELTYLVYVCGEELHG